MIEASACLKDYVRRHKLPVRTSCDAFIAGVASYLATTGWADWLRERPKELRKHNGVELLDVAPPPSQAALQHAYFFAGGVVAADAQYAHTGSLAVVLAGSWRRMWPAEAADDWIVGTWALELGWRVACEAAGEGVGWEDDAGHPPHGLRWAFGLECGDEYFEQETDSDEINHTT